jgi:hypothetical protein
MTTALGTPVRGARAARPAAGPRAQLSGSGAAGPSLARWWLRGDLFAPAAGRGHASAARREGPRKRARRQPRSASSSAPRPHRAGRRPPSDRRLPSPAASMPAAPLPPPAHLALTATPGLHVAPDSERQVRQPRLRRRRRGRERPAAGGGGWVARGRERARLGAAARPGGARTAYAWRPPAMRRPRPSLSAHLGSREL